MDRLTMTGVAVDVSRSGEKARQLEALRDDYKERLRRRGYLAGERGCDKALQSILREAARSRPGLELARTPTGKWAADEDSLTAGGLRPVLRRPARLPHHLEAA
jgi:hypothetical protein